MSTITKKQTCKNCNKAQPELNSKCVRCGIKFNFIK